MKFWVLGCTFTGGSTLIPIWKNFENFEFENHQSSQIKNPARSKSWFHLWHSYLVSIRLLNVFQGFENLINISKKTPFLSKLIILLSKYQYILITNYCTSELIIWTDCSWLQPILTSFNNLNGLQMTSTYENCLQLLKLIANKCNTFNSSQLMSTDCNPLKLSELVAIAETNCKCLQGISICYDYLNWLQLLKPIARDCSWLDLTYSGEFWKLNGHTIS